MAGKIVNKSDFWIKLRRKIVQWDIYLPRGLIYLQSYTKVRILIFSIITFIVSYFSYMYFFKDAPKRSELILSLASNSWVTLIAGIAGAQTYNYIVTEIRENKKNWVIAKSNFYWPLYSAIMNYFERSTVFRPGELRDVESTPYELKQEIFKIFENNIKYADNNTLIAYYEFQRYKMYDDNSERGSEQRELELFYKVLEAFYLKSLKYKDIRKHDYFFKSRILFFQIWQLAFNAELIDPDGALTYRFQMDTLRLATFYRVKKLNKMQKKPVDKQRRYIKKIIKKTAYNNEYSFANLNEVFFDPSNIWEDSMAISIQYMRDEIMQDQGDAILNISNRETLRDALLSKVYHDTFSEKLIGIQYELKQYSRLAVEKRLAYQYLNDKRFIEIITNQESILIKITASGMERYEESDKQRRRTMYGGN